MKGGGRRDLAAVDEEADEAAAEEAGEAAAEEAEDADEVPAEGPLELGAAERAGVGLSRIVMSSSALLFASSGG